MSFLCSVRNIDQEAKMQPSLELVEETLQKGDLQVPCVNHCHI